MDRNPMHLAGSVLLSLAFLAGCGAPQPYVTKDRLKRGLVVVLPGIEGRSPFNEAICQGLDEGGVDYAIELRDWTMGVPLGFALNLWSIERNRKQASDLAERITRYQFNYPGRPVVLVGQSGGSAIAAWACEAMKWDRKVDGVVMLAAALSLDYHLTTALGSTRRGIVSFYSGRDVLLLWAGTTVYRTMDGKHTSAAGCVGFTVPPPKSKPEEYNKLFQVPWRPEMADTGHIGMHLTSGTAMFVATYVAPLVKAPRWDGEVIDRVMRRLKPPTSTRPATLPAGVSRQGRNRAGRDSPVSR